VYNRSDASIELRGRRGIIIEHWWGVIIVPPVTIIVVVIVVVRVVAGAIPVSRIIDPVGVKIVSPIPSRLSFLSRIVVIVFVVVVVIIGVVVVAVARAILLEVARLVAGVAEDVVVVVG